ncbi:ABC transporter substrate-binding protein [Rhodocyclaceae bacterium SMB388]
MRIVFLLLLLWPAIGLAQDPACPRIVSQSPYISQQLAWLGLDGCVVGASRYERLVQNALDTGGVLDPDAEAIALLEPDLIITSNWTPSDTLAALTPPVAIALRLDSFASMAQIEDNLRQIARAAGLADGDARADEFARTWREKADNIGQGQRALLLSSCSGQPYSFGRETWLTELFETAGFEIVETETGVAHLSQEMTSEDILHRMNDLRPEYVFVFTRQVAQSCATIPWPDDARLVVLDGEKFLHPAPTLLHGLDDLRRYFDKTAR